jgi:hypothetical protein
MIRQRFEFRSRWIDEKERPATGAVNIEVRLSIVTQPPSVGEEGIQGVAADHGR